MGQRTKKILEWIEAYSRLVDKDIEYFEKSIKEPNPLNNKYRRISDKYNEATNNLIKKLP